MGIVGYHCAVLVFDVFQDSQSGIAGIDEDDIAVLNEFGGLHLDLSSLRCVMVILQMSFVARIDGDDAVSHVDHVVVAQFFNVSANGDRRHRKIHGQFVNAGSLLADDVIQYLISAILNFFF